MFNRLKKIIRRLKYKKALASTSIESRFSNIYKYKLWFSNRESESGAGSTLRATQHIREELPTLLKEVRAKNLVDIGCGDFYWMKEVHLPCDYVGIDIVKSVVERNISLYAKSDVKFIHGDMIEEPIPLEADVILCREVIFHLSYNDGLKLINNISSSNARYFIVTSDSAVLKNKDIRTGAYRSLNLNLPPYKFPPATIKIEDSGVSISRYLGVWEIKTLRNLDYSK